MARFLSAAFLLSLMGCQGSTSTQSPGVEPDSLSAHGSLNICVFGYTDDDNLKLVAGLQRLFSDGQGNSATVDQLRMQAEHDITHLEFNSPKNQYAQIVISSNVKPRRMFPTLASLDAAIVVVGKDQVVDERSLVNLQMARAAGVTQLTAIVESELTATAREALAGVGFREPLVIVGDVENDDTIKEVVQGMDTSFVAKRPTTGSFVFPIDDVFWIAQRGMIVTGRIERGTVRKGDSVEMIGYGQRRTVRVKELEQFSGKLPYASAGDHVGALLEGVERDEVLHGFLLTQTGAFSLVEKFDAILSLRGETLRDEFMILVRSAELGAAAIPRATTDADESVTIQLAVPHAVEEGLQFVVLSNGEFVGTGTIISIDKTSD